MYLGNNFLYQNNYIKTSLLYSGIEYEDDLILEHFVLKNTQTLHVSQPHVLVASVDLWSSAAVIDVHVQVREGGGPLESADPAFLLLPFLSYLQAAVFLPLSPSVKFRLSPSF